MLQRYQQGYKAFMFRCDEFAYRNSTDLPIPSLILTWVSSSMVLIMGIL